MNATIWESPCVTFRFRPECWKETALKFVLVMSRLIWNLNDDQVFASKKRGWRAERIVCLREGCEGEPGASRKEDFCTHGGIGKKT